MCDGEHSPCIRDILPRFCDWEDKDCPPTRAIIGQIKFLETWVINTLSLAHGSLIVQYWDYVKDNVEPICEENPDWIEYCSKFEGGNNL